MPETTEVTGTVAGETTETTGAATTETTTASPSIGWRTELPTSLRDNEAFAGYETKNSLWEGHIAAVSKVKDLEGKLAGAIPKLTATSTDEEKAAYYAAMGVPESPDKYEFDRPKMPDGIPYNEAMENWFRKAAHKAGISQEAAKVLYGDYMQFGNAFLEQQQVQRQTTLAEGMKALEGEWGNKFEANCKVAQEVQKAIGLADPAMKKVLSDHNLENEPVIVKWLINLAPAYLGDNAPMGQPAGTKPTGGLEYPSMKSLGG